MASDVATPPEKTLVDLIKKVTTIATLPEVTSRIIETVEDPRSSAAKLHRIVSHDPALVMRILKVVNSAFYGLPGQVGSVERAIVLLGLNAVKNIAVAASLGQLFRGAKLSAGFGAKDLWTHCIAVAITARDLAVQSKLAVADEAFLAGMIHDVGMLISLQNSPEALRQVCERAAASCEEAATIPGTAGPTFCQLERETIGVDHQQLGMALAEHWKFPRSCQLVAGYHHEPLSLGEPPNMLVNLVWAADTICCHSKYGFTLTGCRQTLDHESISAVGLEPQAVEATQGRLDELIESAAGFLA